MIGSAKARSAQIIFALAVPTMKLTASTIGPAESTLCCERPNEYLYCRWRMATRADSRTKSDEVEQTVSFQQRSWTSDLT